jgi:hypothetical protein
MRRTGGPIPRQALLTTAVVNPKQGQAAVAVQTVPPQIGDLEGLAAHGLHRVPEQRLYFTDLDGACSMLETTSWL